MKRLLGLVAVTLLAACSGAHNPLPSTPANTAAKERVTIKIDMPKNGSATRARHYVSQATTQQRAGFHRCRAGRGALWFTENCANQIGRLK